MLLTVCSVADECRLSLFPGAARRREDYLGVFTAGDTEVLSCVHHLWLWSLHSALFHLSVSYPRLHCAHCKCTCVCHTVADGLPSRNHAQVLLQTSTIGVCGFSYQQISNACEIEALNIGVVPYTTHSIMLYTVCLAAPGCCL